MPEKHSFSAHRTAEPETGGVAAKNVRALDGKESFQLIVAEPLSTHSTTIILNPSRCPTVDAPQFVAPDGTRLPTPNGDFAADSIATRLAHVMSTMVTNPSGSGWYDRHGLENADKCQNTFGQTYTTTNGARANIRLGGRDYLLGQNWVNDRKGRCAMQLGE